MARDNGGIHRHEKPTTAHSKTVLKRGSRGGVLHIWDRSSWRTGTSIRVTKLAVVVSKNRSSAHGSHGKLRWNKSAVTTAVGTVASAR